MRAVITVVGHDKIGIIADVSHVLAAHKVNILDISQTIMQDFFTMIMLVETKEATASFKELSGMLDEGEARIIEIMKSGEKDITEEVQE